MKRAFTLIELMIVMAAIAGLVGLIMVTFKNSRDRTLDVQRKSDLKQYQAALEVYASKNNHMYPPTAGSMRDVCPELQLLNCPENSVGDYHYQPYASRYSYYIWGELAEQSDHGDDQYHVICSDGHVADIITLPSGTACPMAGITPTATPPTAPSNTPIPTNTPIPGGNLIGNGSFESGATNSWSWWADGGASFTVVNGGTDGSQMANINKTNSTGTNIQLFQRPLAMTPNTNYRITFDARANINSRFLLYVHRHDPSSPISYGLSDYNVNLTNVWQSFEIDFTSTASASSDARLRFWFVPSPVSVINIDNVMFFRL
ncbi:carbohydrate binding domain-containing protein [Patescibacteria group bacterium]